MKDITYVLRSVLRMMSRRLRLRFYYVVLLAFFVSLLEVVGIAAILPFVQYLSDPGIELPFLFSILFDWLSATTEKERLLSLGVIAVSLLISSNVARLWFYRTQFFYSSDVERHLTTHLFASILWQDFEISMNRNGNEVLKDILSEVAILVNRGLQPLIMMLAQAITISCMLGLVFFVDPLSGIAVFIIYSVLYSFILFILKNKIARNANIRFESNEKRFIVVNEGIRNLKYVKVSHNEGAFLSAFKMHASRFASSQASNLFLAAISKPFIEAVTFSAVIVLIMYLYLTIGTVGEVLPTLTLFIFAGYRMLPGVQMIFNARVQIRSILPSVKKLASITSDFPEIFPTPNKLNRFIFSGLELQSVAYRYPNADNFALKDISLSVNPGDKICLIGATGGGKSTLINLILGLLRPTAGAITINRECASAIVYRKFQETIGYVPQDVYLSHDTIANNIGLGLDLDELDMDWIREVSKIVAITEFVEQVLPDGYRSMVSDNGANLSGGQRQRIGIARALYRKPQVLILDEATSALDRDTEQKILEGILSFDPSLTIIMITHNEELTKFCDRVFEVSESHIQLVQ